MTDQESRGHRDPAREELYVFITLGVREGKTDGEIAAELGMPGREVWRIRRKILHINNYGRKRNCPKCNGLRPITLFKTRGSFTTESSHWCLYCRRIAGIDRYERKEKFNQRIRGGKPLFKLILCLRCDHSFSSPIFPDGSYNHLCNHCRIIVRNMERVSIE